MDYKSAGVDVEAGRDFVRRIKSRVESTYRPEVLGNLGGFSGLFSLPTGYQEPVLVSGTDGVGTKLRLAHQMQKHDTVGIDLVAMCVNDVLTCGAEPLFFLDYLATGHLEPAELAQVVDGVATGCQQAGCALLGGETAEMPGFYQPQEYDLAGFCVGIVDRPKVLDGSKIAVGDAVIGLASSGVHSNGFSLVRKIVEEKAYTWGSHIKGPEGQTLGEVLLTPTQIYVKPIHAALKAGLTIHGMAHITGGGLPENLPRCLSDTQSVQIDPQSWEPLPIFQWLEQEGHVPIVDMYNTFNMGIGFVVIVPNEQASATLEFFQAQDIIANQIGTIIEGKGEVLGLPT
ncbi:phosphoribosylformylglycinamidine cyclo-ligase [filamentous cyanobacterium LEGE 11480]|uniref:Phosphoribosylformylglycinamidine cyclo-ligase n=1 Tax=Romeriopsis navalis LEGE 11480 TaxID=2777977 RepID=A0A928VLW1_9CYAN|nr:phosphoribosylformylglycinamidine cyclo-ligase [Romeriopsis navalis]MBE9030113.1 phosphoribosylformylglycinamidine cyclo-ligase [Romeriopsis navalis LEGE 11480]